MAGTPGVVKYWNGKSGWITPSGMEEERTCHARDILALNSDVVDGSLYPGCVVTYTWDCYSDLEPWRAKEITISPQ